MNPYSGFKRGRSWDEAEPSSFGSPKLRRFDGGGAMSRHGDQHYDSQGYRGFRGEPSGNYGHQEQGWSQGASRGGGFGSGSRGGFSDFGGRGAGGARGRGMGGGSTISRIMNMASGSGGGSYSQGDDSSFVDYSGCNQHQQSDYGGGGGGMHNDGFGGRGGSFGNPRGAGGFGNSRGARGGGRFPGHSGAPRGRGIGYDTAPQFGQDSGGFDVGGGSYNQRQFSTDQRAGGRGGDRGGFNQRGGGQRGGGERGQRGGGGRGGQVGRGGRRADGGDRAGASRGGGRGGGRGAGQGGGRGAGRGGGHGAGRGGGRGGAQDQGRGQKRTGKSAYRRNEHPLLDYATKFKENTLPLEMRFVNLCKVAKQRVQKMPKLVMASSTLEQFLLYDNICLTPAYVFKGERIEQTQPFYFRCKVYINNIFIASGMASNKKEAKNKGCETAIKVLGTKNSQVIIATHEKVNVMALGKQDADIVECPISSVESNIGNILSVPESSEKKSISDFYILQPEDVDKATGMNSTCILRQSADFSHLLLKYEFTTSDQGFLCTVNVEGKTLATAAATQQNTAKNLASNAALQNLRQTNWTILVIKRDKARPAQKPLTATLGHIRPNDPYSHQQFTQNLKDYLGTYFAGLGDHTKWLPLSQELDRDERDAVYSVAKEMDLRVESKRVDGARGRIGEDGAMFLVVSKKLLCQDLFDYIWGKGGETWRYKLRAPGEIGPT